MEDTTAIKFFAFLILGVIVFLLINPLVIITAGHRGVVLNWGAVSDTVLGEGIHWRVPIQQDVKSIEVRTVKMETNSLAYSKDIQTVDTAIALNYHLNPDTVNTLYQTLGMNYESTYISPAIQESIKAISAKFTAQELVDKREIVRDGIKASLEEILTCRGIYIDAFSITNFDFSDEYEKAVEAKQVAQQSALKAQNDLERVKMEAEQRIAQAKAEAEAIKIQAEAVTSQGGEDYVKLQWVEAWRAGGSKVPTFITGNNGTSFLMNIGEL